MNILEKKQKHMALLDREEKKAAEVENEIALLISRQLLKELETIIPKLSLFDDQMTIKISHIKMQMAKCTFKQWKYFNNKSIEEITSKHLFTGLNLYTVFNNDTYHKIIRNLWSLLRRKHNLICEKYTHELSITFSNNNSRQKTTLFRDRVRTLIIINWWKKQVYKPQGVGYKRSHESFQELAETKHQKK